MQIHIKLTAHENGFNVPRGATYIFLKVKLTIIRLIIYVWKLSQMKNYFIP